jgi:hypothetical protein
MAARWAKAARASVVANGKFRSRQKPRLSTSAARAA